MWIDVIWSRFSWRITVNRFDCNGNAVVNTQKRLKILFGRKLDFVLVKLVLSDSVFT